MSTPGSSPDAGGKADQMHEYGDSHSQGLVTFAGVMIMIAAVLNTLYGIAAIDKAQFFVNDAKYVFADLKTFGGSCSCSAWSSASPRSRSGRAPRST